MTSYIYYYLFQKCYTLVDPPHLKEVITDKMTDKHEMITYLPDVFYTLQKIYNGFARLAYLYKLKKAKRCNMHDLGLNPISHTNPRRTFQILQNGSFYVMTLPELIHIINTSLTYVNSFFILEPYMPKNPYTNIPLDKSTLYNIYFAVKSSDYKMSPLLHAFFIHEFNLNSFIETNQNNLLEYAIHHYIYKSHENVLYEHVIHMLDKNHLTSNLCISPDFPKKIIVNIMRPYLHLYFRYHYANVCDEVWSFLREELHTMLNAFYIYNPMFGRKYIRRHKGSPNEVIFNTKHIPIDIPKQPIFIINFV